MNYQEYIAILESQTGTQSLAKQKEFAVMICKKLYFEYQSFVDTYHWGDADLLMDAIKLCSYSINHAVEPEKIIEMLPKIDHITPHIDEFDGSEISSYALNASASVYETLEFLIDENKTHVFNIATYYTDTIDFKIQEEKKLSDSEIENHPQMIEAWNFIIEQTKKQLITNDALQGAK